MSTHDMHGHWPHLPPAARGLRIAGFVVLAVAGAAVFGLAFGWLVMLLWNWLMPEIFHLGQITYWQGFGIVVLAKIIFGGMHTPRRPGHGRGPWKGGRGSRDEWHLYRDFWEQEGRQAFDAYAAKKRAETSEPRDA